MVLRKISLKFSKLFEGTHDTIFIAIIEAQKMTLFLFYLFYKEIDAILKKINLLQAGALSYFTNTLNKSFH